MSARWVSAPVTVTPDISERASRADFEFIGVDHSGPSFEARVFLNNPDADESTPLAAIDGYAGSFYVFGHGGCFGDVGHCDVPEGGRRPFDRRMSHPLTPANKTVIATDAVRRLAHEGVRTFTVTVVAMAVESASPHVSADQDDFLELDRVSLLTYQ